MSFKHIIISRVNIPRKLDPSKYDNSELYKDPEWNQRRIELLNNFTRPSLRQQTIQDFEYVTLWGPQYPRDEQNRLENERQIYIEREVDEFDEQAFDFTQWRKNPKNCEKIEMDFAFQIRDKLKEIYDPPVLFTNIDSDDCLRFDFVEKVQQEAQKYLNKKKEMIIDIQKRYCMHVESGGQGQKVRSSPSPATSSLEIRRLKCWPLRFHHSMMLDYLPSRIGFTQVEGLLIMQTVTDTNILTQGTGDDGHFNPKHYF